MEAPNQPPASPASTHTVAIWTGMGPHAEMEANNIQRLLSASGIESVLNGSSPIPTVEFEVLVTGDQASAARQVLADALAAGPTAAELAERQTEPS